MLFEVHGHITEDQTAMTICRCIWCSERLERQTSAHCHPIEVVEMLSLLKPFRRQSATSCEQDINADRMLLYNNTLL